MDDADGLLLSALVGEAEAVPPDIELVGEGKLDGDAVTEPLAELVSDDVGAAVQEGVIEATEAVAATEKEALRVVVGDTVVVSETIEVIVGVTEDDCGGLARVPDADAEPDGLLVQDGVWISEADVVGNSVGVMLGVELFPILVHDCDFVGVRLSVTDECMDTDAVFVTVRVLEMVSVNQNVSVGDGRSALGDTECVGDKLVVSEAPLLIVGDREADRDRPSFEVDSEALKDGERVAVNVGERDAVGCRVRDSEMLLVNVGCDDALNERDTEHEFSLVREGVTDKDGVRDAVGVSECDWVSESLMERDCVADTDADSDSSAERLAVSDAELLTEIEQEDDFADESVNERLMLSAMVALGVGSVNDASRLALRVRLN